MMIKKLIPLQIFCLLLLTACGQRNMPDKGRMGALGKQVMVVTDHPDASWVGADILENGGNGFDAAVGVQFALAVVLPYAGNIGGGGFAVIRMGNGEIASLDYREKAPLAAHRDMYLDSNGNVIQDLSTATHLAVGVPGAVDGMVKLHEKYGKMEWATIVGYSIKLARDGFVITERQAEEFNRERENFEQRNRDAAYVPMLGKAEWKAGDTLYQPQLAKTLERIRDQKRAGFYEGESAKFLVEEMEKGGGLITQEDLDQYESVWREPITGTYRGHKIISMGPPSSGGIALVQLFGMVEPFPLKDYGLNSHQATHIMVEAERRVYADRAKHLGDMDFWEVPIAQLTSADYIKSRMKDFAEDTVMNSDSIFAGNFKAEGEETTHFSIVDAEGNAISITTTINSAYGSRIFVEGAGYLLNNEMDDFSSKPGEPNSYGLIGAEANAIQGGKRMLSSMTPTIVEKEGELYMVVGTPGGSTIITSVFQTIVNVVDYEFTMKEAVRSKRFHHQWKPNLLFHEEGAFEGWSAQKLVRMGHILQERSEIGSMNCILIWPDGWIEGGADRRRDNSAMGF